jgi:hypothetical protein
VPRRGAEGRDDGRTGAGWWPQHPIFSTSATAPPIGARYGRRASKQVAARDTADLIHCYLCGSGSVASISEAGCAGIFSLG